MQYIIKKINDLNISSLGELAEEAENEGFGFVQKTIDEWESGVNNFSKTGEILFGVFVQNKCVAIGGLNVDPYANDFTLGRVRHLYVSQNYRRKGIATALLKKIIEKARKYFKVLRVSTHGAGTTNLKADKFYESLGFVKNDGLKQTHFFRLDEMM